MSYPTAVECLTTLQSLRSDDAPTLQRECDAILEALLHATPPSRRHLEVLEAMRGPLAQALTACSLNYSDRPVAPSTPENEALLAVCATWSRMAEAYSAILQDTALGNSAETHTLLVQRRTDCLVRALVEYMRAHRAVPSSQWAAVHESLIDAEARGLARVRAPDPLNPWQAQSASEAHTVALLMDLANPFSRMPRELGQIWHCARYFAPYCHLLPTGSADDDGRRTAYGLDLAGNHGLRPLKSAAPSDNIRRFESVQLPEQFRQLNKHIRKQHSVAELTLDPSVGVDEAVRLLLSLYRPWARGSSGRRFTRRPGRGHVDLTGNWKAIGFYIAGKAFTQPKLFGMARSVTNDLHMLTLGERVAEAANDKTLEVQRAAQHRGYICSRWEILDQSPGGFRLRCTHSADRLEHRELIAVRPGDMKSFLLGMVNWVMYREDGTLEAGVKVLEGIPTSVGVRSVGIGKNKHDINFQESFHLTATPALDTPATLVLPAGYFQPFRVVELFDDKLRGYRLLELVNRGADFDQATFERVTLSG